MRRRMMKSKIHRATVTDADLHYVGLDHRRPRPDGRWPTSSSTSRSPSSTSTTAPASRPTSSRASGAGRRSASTAPPPASCPPATGSSSSATPTTSDAELERLRSRRSSTSTPPTGRSTRLTAELLAADHARPGAPPLRRASQLASTGHRRRAADRPIVLGQCRRRWPTTSTCWSSGPAWPGCRPPCGPPSCTACGSACSPRASSTRPPPGGPRAAWPPCSAATTRLHRPPPRRHARRRRRPVRRRRRAGARRRGPGRVHELIALGAVFDRDAEGQLRAGPRGRPLAAPHRPRRRRGHRRRDRAGAGRRRAAPTAAACYEHYVRRST